MGKSEGAHSKKRTKGRGTEAGIQKAGPKHSGLFLWINSEWNQNV